MSPEDFLPKASVAGATDAFSAPSIEKCQSACVALMHGDLLAALRDVMAAQEAISGLEHEEEAQVRRFVSDATSYILRQADLIESRELKQGVVSVLTGH